MNLSQFSMNFDAFRDVQMKIKKIAVALVTVANKKNTKPYSNIDFALNNKKAAVVSINSAKLIKMTILVELNESHFWLE